jgi:hypothetical protein
MFKGRILKIRPGHEANCSSGMIPMFMLVLGSGASFLLTLGPSIALVLGHCRSTPSGRLSKWYLIAPLVLGWLVVAGLVLWLYPESYSRSDEAAIVVLGLGIAASYSLAVAAGYRLVPRLRGWICLLTPLICALGVIISAVVAFFLVS